MAGIDGSTGAIRDGIEAQTEQALLNLAAVPARLDRSDRRAAGRLAVVVVRESTASFSAPVR
jgi:hypothetical protein